MAEIWTMGEMIVEIMREKENEPLDKAGVFRGPYPSGAPAIFIDTVARLGHKGGIIGGVGKDDFGKCLLDRLKSDGVDVSHVIENPKKATGCAIVTYFDDGSRKFIFHMGNTPAVEAKAPQKTDILRKVMTAILAGGHVLIEDIPGTGKMTLALSFSHAMGLKVNRVQFTPDVLPADLSGFTIYDKASGAFVYQPGAAICNLLLADEINRTSPKTQSALLEVMEEHQVTVDGKTHRTGEPFIVIATENPVGSAGTQLLPESQLDRFMICVSMGYPTAEEEIEILKREQSIEKTRERIDPVVNAEELIQMQREVKEVFVHDWIFGYIVELAKATRENEWTELGLSPRGTVALTAMAKACAWLNGREYVVPSDVQEIFPCVTEHRIILNMKAKVGHIKKEELIRRVLESVPTPTMRQKY